MANQRKRFTRAQRAAIREYCKAHTLSMHASVFGRSPALIREELFGEAPQRAYHGDSHCPLPSLREASVDLSGWLAAALDNPLVPSPMQQAIVQWFRAFPDDWWSHLPERERRAVDAAK